MNGFLAYRRRPPAEPSAREIDFARRWLARRGVAVSLPTRLAVHPDRRPLRGALRMASLREAVQATAPAMYTLPVLFDIFGEGRQPPAFTGLLIGYVALCLALQCAGPIALSRRK